MWEDENACGPRQLSSRYTLSDSAAEHLNTLVYMETRGRGTAAIVAKIKEGLGERSTNRTTSCTSSLPPSRALAVIVVKIGTKLEYDDRI